MRLGIPILTAAIIIAALLVGKPGITGDVAGSDEFAVAKTVDGDTIRLISGDRVRFLNIDTPETGQYLHDEAAARLKSLIANGTVKLEADRTNKDKYGRLLRYVYSNGTMLNLIMVREGYARAYYIAPDDKHLAEIREAEAEAKEKGLGIWQYDNITGAFCVWLYTKHPDAKGRDEDNLNDEYMVFRNSCTHPVNLSGWKLDAERGYYIFPNFTIQAKKTVTVRTGSGTNNATDLYWGSAKPVWKNADDTLLAYNADGLMTLNYSY